MTMKRKYTMGDIHRVYWASPVPLSAEQEHLEGSPEDVDNIQVSWRVELDIPYPCPMEILGHIWPFPLDC
jgi:hypothetical protein